MTTEAMIQSSNPAETAMAASSPPHWQNDLIISIWSFATGGALVIAFLFLWVGFQSLSKSHSLWDIDVTDVMLILIGAGLSIGCFAVIGNYLIRSPRNDLPLHHKADI